MFGKKIIITPAMFGTGVKVCKKCGNITPVADNCCTNCGKKQFYYKYSEYEITTKTVCINCGTEQKTGQLHCPNCGGRFVSYKIYETKKSSHNSKDKRAKALAALALVLSAILAVGLLIFGIYAVGLYEDAVWPPILVTLVACSIVMTIPLILDRYIFQYRECGHWIALAISIMLILAISGLSSFEDYFLWSIGLAISVTVNNLAGYITCMIRDKFEKPAKVYLIMTVISAMMILAVFLQSADYEAALYMGNYI